MSNEASFAIMAQTIQELTSALQQSDQRQRRMDRVMRWSVGCLMVFLSIGMYLGVELNTRAYAAETSLRKDLDETGQLLKNLNMMVGGLAQQMQQQDSPMNQFFSNVSTLTARVKEDSDKLRGKHVLGEVSALHQMLKAELHLLNGALTSVPTMALEMQRMSANMAVMAYSVNSTMGRMGSMVPW